MKRLDFIKSRLDFYLWFIPSIVIGIIFSFQMILASLYIGRIVTIISIGLALGILAIILTSYYITRHPLGRIFVGILFILFYIFVITLVYAYDFRSFILIFILSTYTFGFSVYEIIISIKNWKASIKQLKSNPDRKIMVKALFIVAIMGVTAFLSTSSLYYNYSSTSFTITDEQAQNYELVLYYPYKIDIDEDFCKLMQVANVSVISFQMNEYEFEEGSQYEINAAYAVRNLTNHGIKVEIWPLFDSDDGHYPSISEIDRFPHLYDCFHNWTIRNSLDVDYILWDIESEGEGPDFSITQNWIEPFKSIGIFGGYVEKIANLSSIWENANQAIVDLAKNANNDGHIVRTTTHTIIYDEFDGDGDGQMLAGIPAWDSKDAYEYISMMSYRGCEWGGTPGTSASIYEHVKASAITQTGKIAICIGCINYNPYPNITSVVNDVHLSLAAGADSVRIFQGASWVYGVGEDIDRDVWGNIAHGFNSTENEGLLQLMQACRLGGEVTNTPEANVDLSFFNNILIDVILNIV